VSRYVVNLTRRKGSLPRRPMKGSVVYQHLPQYVLRTKFRHTSHTEREHVRDNRAGDGAVGGGAVGRGDGELGAGALVRADRVRASGTKTPTP